MDGFSDLNLFALVARHRNLAAAARELGVTPPAVSKRLAQLERRLGVRLMNRTTRRLSLTPEGELYLSNGSRILDELSELEQLVMRSRAEPTGLLRVNASFGFGRAHIAPAVSEFVARFPAMKIQLHLTDRPMSLQDEGFDVGIRFGEVPDARINARLLLKNRRIVCASPAYLEQYGKPSVPHDLTRHACIVLRENDSAYGTWHLSRGKRTETIKVDGALSSNDGGTVLHWALEGRGIVVRSQWEIDGYLARGELVPLLDDWALPDANIHAIYLERNQLSVKLRTFVDFLGKYLQTS
ncbi:LysR family transcriptional regulator [Paraburkholderia fungorum]|jgi:LysR family transcriptional activator of dmlA|uniref:DNA-binding transcriptional LysR family regulator n=1 Tax=Paraburkholderia fungorum TaxID=134537 RepID=A0AAW3USA5_9BURK|nr:LysR family transcriptional regulator [Paraburkholderia fungorum]MBB4513259.1 DNA-binding transcriptional LysR family regulator [Paraburkholderia fungorum]MBB5540984.1 DNA-binding transcriptional LysR family regulator [Paraburkholderia fungorum]MBB6201314.1 DNA-binding transcriptional LysR family regulator [Paraburkholderia fungorum]PNE53738.1 LysR family transcriptional regulator [Paraburkholderia fungorum]